jgi:hydrogenase maturation protease
MNAAKPEPRHLLIGMGNASRGDDGLGWLFARRAEQVLAGLLDVVSCYQLQVEDAELIRSYDVVHFVDATRETLPGGCALQRCLPLGGPSFSSHRQSPGAVLALCQELYGASPEAWVLAIEGRSWELGSEPGDQALQHLDKAWSLWHSRFSPGMCTLD